MYRFLLVEAQKLRELDLTSAYGIKLPMDVVQPLGLIQIAAVIKEHESDAEIRILDMRLPGEDNASFSSFVKDYAPNFIGFRTVSRDSHFMNGLVYEARALVPGTILVAGGPHVSACGARVMEEAPFDFAVAGEGEGTLKELLEMLSGGGEPDAVRGIIYRDREGRICTNEPREPIKDLETLPRPLWELLPHDRYFDMMDFPHIPAHLNACREVVSIFTSRGCPYGCTFCHNIFGKRFRARSAGHVVDEMEYLTHRFGIRQFDIRDDIFNLDRKRVFDICDRIIKRGLNIRISFPNGLRGDLVDEELVLALKSAGMFSCTYALETASPRLQKMTRKHIDLDRLRHIIRFTSAQEVITKVFVMLGFPTETREEMAMTVDYALDDAIDFVIAHTVNPFEGTEVAEQVSARGIDVRALRENFDYLQVNFSVSEVSTEELDAIKTALFVKFFTARRMENTVRKLRLYRYV
jgi:anaerobic magnesium-protoporphyrin IX monomethyl ester cyclase